MMIAVIISFIISVLMTSIVFFALEFISADSTKTRIFCTLCAVGCGVLLIFVMLLVPKWLGV